MEQTWYLTERMVLGITSDFFTGMDELKPLSCFYWLTIFFAPDLYDPFMVVAIIYLYLILLLLLVFFFFFLWGGWWGGVIRSI